MEVYRLRTRKTYSNCLLAAIYLILRGKASKIVAVSSQSKWWPHHYIILNKSGHVLHFRNSRPHHENTCAPWWFEGYFEGIHNHRKEEVLRRYGRTVKFQTERMWLALCLLLGVVSLMAIPWMLSWAFYPLIWCCWWGVQALTKN